MPWKGNAPMPSCNAEHQQEIVDAIEALSSAERVAARRLLAHMGPKELCRVLHAIRRWYSYNCWNAAKKILPYREGLMHFGAMDLRPSTVRGAYRGFKVDRNDALLNGVTVGRPINLPVARNGGCSSWTLGRKLADRFSGGGKGKVGLVVQFLDGEDVEPFIAPPSRSAAWWNALYGSTMGTSFRFKEQEYALASGDLRVRVVAVKP